MSYMEIAGHGAYVPKRVVTNDELSRMVDTSDEWIFTRTGIRQRRIAENENTSDMAVAAAREILESAGVSASEVELIIVTTGTPDYLVPSAACLVQKGIGAWNAFCFDLNAACAGFLYGMSAARGMLDRYDNILLIGAEMLSKLTDWTDRKTCVLFGDAAGGALLRRSEKPRRYAEFLRSDGRGAEYLTMGYMAPTGMSESFLPYSKVDMNSREVYNFVVNTTPETIQGVLGRAGIGMESVRYIVPHQANLRMVEGFAKKMGLPMDKFYMTIGEFANTSSASIPVTLDRMFREKLIGGGDIIILTAFGGGLTCGSTLIEL